MNILLIGHELAVGGFGRFTHDFCSLDLPVKITLYNIARPLKKKIKPYQVGTYATITNAGLGRLAQSLLVTFSRIIKFPHLLKRVNPDIIYCAAGGNIPFWDACPYILLSSSSRSKIVFHWLGPFEPFYHRSGSFVRRIFRIMFQRLDAMVVLSRRDEKLLSSIVQDKPILYVPSSVNVELFDAAQASDLLPDINKYFNILFLGGIDPYRKGLVELLEALPSIIASTDRHIRLVVTGGDACREVIEDAAPHIRKHVIFLGWINEEDKYGLYKACDVMALPSFDEGMPYALVEAMAASLPVVSTLVGGIPDLIQDGSNGFLIPPGQPSELADRIARLANDTNLFKRISETNRVVARKKYSVHTMFQNILDLCEDLIASNI